jgi:hypothetical protein
VLFPAGLADEIGHDEDRRAALDQVGGRAQQVVQPRGPALGGGAAVQHAVQQVQHVAAAAAGGDHGLDAGAVQHGADAVAVAREQARQHGHEFGRDVALAQLARAEVDRGAQVHQEPGRHLAVFGEHAHVRHLHARRDVPVDVAHVVVQLVFAQVGQVEPGAAQQRAVVALQQAVEPADDLPLEPAQHLLGVVGARCRGGGAAATAGRVGFRRSFLYASQLFMFQGLRRGGILAMIFCTTWSE